MCAKTANVDSVARQTCSVTCVYIQANARSSASIPVAGRHSHRCAISRDFTLLLTFPRLMRVYPAFSHSVSSLPHSDSSSTLTCVHIPANDPTFASIQDAKNRLGTPPRLHATDECTLVHARTDARPRVARRVSRAVRPSSLTCANATIPTGKPIRTCE
jgi:hypothetical protein